jgi:hypothetical protein
MQISKKQINPNQTSKCKSQKTNNKQTQIQKITKQTKTSYFDFSIMVENVFFNCTASSCNSMPSASYSVEFVS